MKKIIYYIATSLDGFIANSDSDVSSFIHEGNAVNHYLNELTKFQTVIMGRSTYEFGYQYGLVPGQAAYAKMEHYIFSNSLKFETQSDQVHVKKLDIKEIDAIKRKSDTDIYLCGGGQFAGWLMNNKQIDELRIKLNPNTLGNGIPLFGIVDTFAKWDLYKLKQYDDGMLILSYKKI